MKMTAKTQGKDGWVGSLHRFWGAMSLLGVSALVVSSWFGASAVLAQEGSSKRGRKGMIPQVVQTKPSAGSVYSAGQMPRYTPPMLKAPGHDLVQAYCTTCHSTSYITMQPPFPSSVWRAEVNKMIHTYGASIPKDTAEKIIAYLSKHYNPQTIAETYAKIAQQRTKRPKAKAPLKANTPPPTWMAKAKQFYTQKCMACHQAHGGGLPGAFPPLAGHAYEFAQKPERRAYMIRAVMYGLQGHIKVAGKDYFGMMPPLPPTSDEELALILNYVTRAWGNQARQKAQPIDFTAKEIKAQRGLTWTPMQTYNARKALGL